jgi:hypothetical protein
LENPTREVARSFPVYVLHAVVTGNAWVLDKRQIRTVNPLGETAPETLGGLVERLGIGVHDGRVREFDVAATSPQPIERLFDRLW